MDVVFEGGGRDQRWGQAAGAGAVRLYAFVVTGLIGLALHKTLGFRIERDAEVSGIDLEEHAEASYDLGTLGGGGLRHAGAALFGSNPAALAGSESKSNPQGASA